MLLIVGLVAAVVRTFLVASHEPVYQGEKLSAWLEDVPTTAYGPAHGYDGWRYEAAAENAIKHTGTNAIPFLLQEIHTKDAPWTKLLMRLAVKQSHFNVAFRTAAARRGRAAAAFQSLGPAADAAMPALAGLFDDPESAAEIGFVLTQRGPKMVVPVTQALASGNAAVRFNVVGF